MIASPEPRIAYSALNTFFNFITNLPIVLFNQEESFPSLDGSVTQCDAFDYLPNIIRCVIPSVKKACLSTVLDITNLSLAILNSVLDGGFIYGADYCEIGVKHMTCPHRTVDFALLFFTNRLANSLNPSSQRSLLAVTRWLSSDSRVRWCRSLPCSSFYSSITNSTRRKSFSSFYHWLAVLFPNCRQI